MRAILLSVAVTLLAMPAWANARLTLLMDALAVPEAVAILRDEGLAYGETLDRDMLGGQGGAFWNAQVDKIYDANIIEEMIRAQLDTEMSDEEIEEALAFFSAPEGARIITLENAARRAMADPEVENAALDIYASMKNGQDPLMGLVTQYIDVNGLLERNVTGAMSANYQFYKGLSDGRFQGTRRSNDDILQEVWAQENVIREDTRGWLNGFLLMAYQPIPLDDLEAYVAFSETPAGKSLNAGLFSGFEIAYRDISYALGRAVALSADGDEI